ncbi:MAG TPA: carboxypeptidase-like regulatory domain-containing protein [Candidatus Angelobacter sp.]|nr:carboxypeptidase-like regulatory domain-containing protein [Candidatus Angelobacter sp.]
MAIAGKTILIAIALALPCTAKAEDPQAAIVEGAVINAQNSRTVPRADVVLAGMKGAATQSTRADATGHFIFQHVDPGQYKLTAQRQSFYSDEHKREYQPVIQVAAGQHLKDLAVRLMPSAVVSGEILDEYNDGLQNVEVKLLSRETRLGQMYLKPAGKTVTDDRGQYRISGLRPGKYYLEAEYKPNHDAVQAFKNALADRILERPPGGRTQPAEPLRLDLDQDSAQQSFTFPPLFYPGSGDFQEAQSIQVNPGDEIAANFLFVSAPVVSIKGRVTNGMTGSPASAAVVAAYWTDYVQGEAIEGKVSPEDGTFEIKGVAPGLYKVRASFTEDGQTYEGEQAVEVGNQGARDVEIPGLPNFAAVGHVTLISDGRTVMKRVLVDFVGEGLMPRIRANPVPPEFKFEAQLRPERRYRVNVLNLPEDYYLKAVLISGHEVPADNMVLSGVRGEMELVLSPTGGHIEGTLFDSQDQPVRGSVLLMPDLADPGPAELFRRKGAGADGKFNFRGVPPGSYRLLAMDSLELDDQVGDPDFARKVAGKGDLISVQESGKYTVSVRVAADLR